MRPREIHLKPLGTLAPADLMAPWSADHLDRSRELPPDLRAKVIAYLEKCPLFFAWMGYSSDEIGGRFQVAGGTAIASDGTYFWRLDALDYIREYGIPVPDEAIAHFEAMAWTPPSFEKPEFMRIYRALEALQDDGEPF